MLIVTGIYLHTCRYTVIAVVVVCEKVEFTFNVVIELVSFIIKQLLFN